MKHRYTIAIVAGARPNFIKIAPIIHAIKNNKNNELVISFRLIHTGQHYDSKMSGTFFEELNIPQPDINLNCGGGSQAEQTAAIMVAFEKELLANPVDLVLVVGDVNSTMACSIVAKKLNIKVAHVEAGIRSGDLGMPEEINRIITDAISDYYFTTTSWATDNLIKLGIEANRIHFTGNVMIDTLLANYQRFKKPECFDLLNLRENEYLVLTLHRPSNVDEENRLYKLLFEIANAVKPITIVFPVHPRTENKIIKFNEIPENLKLIQPLGYLEFNYLIKNSKGVITDSGGITEETTVMGIPCITLRSSTERPETVELGTNELIGEDLNKMKKFLKQMISGNWKKGKIPEKWDGKAADRIIEVIISKIANN